MHRLGRTPLNSASDKGVTRASGWLSSYFHARIWMICFPPTMTIIVRLLLEALPYLDPARWTGVPVQPQIAFLASRLWPFRMAISFVQVQPNLLNSEGISRKMQMSPLMALVSIHSSAWDPFAVYENAFV